MAVSAEQKVLQDSIQERISEIQAAIQKALPSAKPLHDEFRVGAPAPKSPDAVIALSRELGPVARQYKALLLPRGVDAAKLAHLTRLTDDLAKLVQAAPTAAAEKVAPVESEPKKAGKSKKSKK